MPKISLFLALSLVLQAQTFRFAILGDRTGETVPGVYEQIWRDIGRARPDFVIGVGDTIQGLQDETAAAEWSEVRRIWARYPYPLYLVPGNHDIWSDASRQLYRKQSANPAFYSFDYQSAHFTMLDNSQSMELSAAQMAFLEKDLAANRGRPLKFVVFHQPFFLIPLKLRNFDLPFHKLMKQYGVRAVLSGHVHQFIPMDCEGVEYIVVGSSGGRLRGHDPLKGGYELGWFFQHIEAAVKNDEVTFTVLETGPPYGKSRTRVVR